MEPSDLSRAIDAAISTAVALGLRADDATVLHRSNRIALRLLPCDVVARVANVGDGAAAREVDLARRLADVGAPVGRLDPRVEPRVYERDGCSVTLWTYYEPASPEITPADYADALVRLHASIRELDLPTPHAMDRVAQAERLVTSPELTPELGDADRALLTAELRGVTVRLGDAEQLLHGEPHPGNVLSTVDGPLFIDLETCCQGPVEFDLAHVPDAVSARYPGVDGELLEDCRRLVLAMVAAWRWEPDDQLPNRDRARPELLRALRAGPPWPTLDEVFGRLEP